MPCDFPLVCPWLVDPYRPLDERKSAIPASVEMPAPDEKRQCTELETDEYGLPQITTIFDAVCMADMICSRCWRASVEAIRKEDTGKAVGSESCNGTTTVGYIVKHVVVD
jgi:hypothetical protein